jgi:threonine/homoserine/homoserine lactone efflux protein
MFISVRGCSVKTAGGCRQLYGLSVISQVSNVLRNHAALVIIALVVVLVIGGVIFPAVWSGKKTRRTAALDVLDRILRWRR